jgi:hypothetical protein
MTNNNSNMRTVYALPERQRNPYPRGSAKHTCRANLNRNIRAHLRHDAQRCKIDGQQLQRMKLASDTHLTHVNNIHRGFYSALNNFHYDEVLIFRWVKIYNIARSLIIDIADIASNAMVAQMTNLLWTKATRIRTLAANGTFTRTSTRRATPMNETRMEHFRQHLAALTQEPILTPAYQFPTLNRLLILMTREDTEDEQQIAIGNMAPPPLHYTPF